MSSLIWVMSSEPWRGTDPGPPEERRVHVVDPRPTRGEEGPCGGPPAHQRRGGSMWRTIRGVKERTGKQLLMICYTEEERRAFI